MTRRISLLAVTIAGAALALSGCVATPDVFEPTPPCGAVTAHPLPACDGPPEPVLLESATYSQSQAIEGFDGSTYVVTEAEPLAELADVLADVDDDVTMVDGCAGGRTTTLDVERVDGVDFTVVVDTCGDDPFAQDVDDLVTRWRHDGVGAGIP